MTENVETLQEVVKERSDVVAIALSPPSPLSPPIKGGE